MSKNKNDIAKEMIGKYCLIRTHSAGVHAGVIAARNGKEVLLKDTRRIWYWDGAASLSQLALEGTSKPENCKFSVTLDSLIVTEAVEIIPCTDRAIESIIGVSDWIAY